MKNIPKSIQDYLKTLDDIQCVDGYLRLNDKQEIVANCGSVGATNITTIDCSINAVQLIPALEGLLVKHLAEPTIIYCVHVDKDHYFDIHLFQDTMGEWVVFIDKTNSAKKMQQEQQIRLAEDFKKDKCRSGS